MKKAFTLCLGILLYAQTLSFSASPLFHAVIAEKYIQICEKDFDEEQKKAFFLGTLFPDIRYLANLSRKSTHEPDVTLEQIYATQDPFLKGMRLHVLTDEVRVKFVKEQQILRKLTDAPGDTVLNLKFLEDEILYSFREKGASLYICDYFLSFADGELQFNVPQEILTYWHNLNSDYFSQRPSDALAHLISNQHGFSTVSLQSTQDSHIAMKLYEDDQEFKNYVLAALKEFERIFSESLQN
jgi:hypothetical protein